MIIKEDGFEFPVGGYTSMSVQRNFGDQAKDVTLEVSEDKEHWTDSGLVWGAAQSDLLKITELCNKFLRFSAPVLGNANGEVDNNGRAQVAHLKLTFGV